MLIAWLAKNWKPLVYVAAILVTLSVVYRNGVNHGRAAAEARMAAAQAKAAAAAKAADTRYAALSAQYQQAEGKIALLLAYRPDPKVLIREVPKAGPTCPAVAPDFRLQYNAIAAGAPPAAGAVP